MTINPSITIQPPANVISSVTARIQQTVQATAQGDFYQITCQAMSTPVRLVFHTTRAVWARDFQLSAIDWIARFEARYSRFIAESIIGQINSSAGGDWISIDEETEELLSLCDQMHALTDGVFDPSSLPLVHLWNWKASPPQIPIPDAIQAALIRCGWNKVRRRPLAICLPTGMCIDLGGIGKEFAVDHLLQMARERGFSDVLIDIGQDIRVCGQPPGKDAWYIGLEEPDQAGKCWTAVRLTNQAVATSGDYLRSFTHNGRRYGHIIDPRTGYPVSNGCQSVNVIAPNCVLAGILSTAAFILGPEEGLTLIQNHKETTGCITTATARHQTRRFSSYVPL